MPVTKLTQSHLYIVQHGFVILTVHQQCGQGLEHIKMILKQFSTFKLYLHSYFLGGKTSSASVNSSIVCT